MLFTEPAAQSDASNAAPPEVILADGTAVSLSGLSPTELCQLQWDQEREFAEAILDSPRNSPERSRLVGQAYDTVCTLFAAQQVSAGPLVMGLDRRYVQLVLELLEQQVREGLDSPRVFEVGYGSGALLATVAECGFAIGGVEISAAMQQQAIQTLGAEAARNLLLGDLRTVDPDELDHRPSLVYWNDVFEHIPPDEIAEYLSHIHKLLMPGGQLVTITPNWLLRPSDVTRLFHPFRTEAGGLHLKEYRLCEVTRLLRQAGFRRIATPLVVSRQRIYLAGEGLRTFKQWLEPALDWLPVKPAHLLCRGLGLSYTIATK